MSSIKEVIKLQKKQINRNNEIKQIIINKMNEKIAQLAKNGILKCIYNIPHFIIGYPYYEIGDLTQSVYKYLIKEGYCCFIIDSLSGKLFISWDINDITVINSDKEKRVKILESLKPLLNIKS